MTMTAWIIAGAASGILAGLVAGYWRGRAVGIACGFLVAGAVWSAAAIYMGNLADEMSGIPYLVGGAMAFWFITVPASVVLAIIGWRRNRSGKG